MKRGLPGLLIAVSLLALTACNLAESQTGDAEKGYVGLAMPTKSSERWVADGKNMERLFRKRDIKPIFNSPRT